MREYRVRDKVVVVTGAASGIGTAICEKFGQEGSRIALLDINEEEVKVRERELIKHGIDAFGQKCDVTSEYECNAAIKEIINHYGCVDVLVNNAGITQRCPFVDARVSMYRKVMDVNFFGSLHCTIAAVGSLIEQKGMIIVTSSIAGLTPVLGRTGYCASKHALHGFFSTLRTELKNYGVHVMIVCPGFTKTNLQTRALDGDGSVTTHAQSRVGSQASPEEVATAIYRGAMKKKRLLVLTPVGKISYMLNKFAPVWYERIMAGRLKEEFKR